MDTATKLPELMGVTEVCETLGVEHGNLDKIKDLPRPQRLPLAGHRIWSADEIRAFARKFRARTGRPPLDENGPPASARTSRT